MFIGCLLVAVGVLVLGEGRATCRFAKQGLYLLNVVHCNDFLSKIWLIVISKKIVEASCDGSFPPIAGKSTVIKKLESIPHVSKIPFFLTLRNIISLKLCGIC